MRSGVRLALNNARTGGLRHSRRRLATQAGHAVLARGRRRPTFSLLANRLEEQPLR
jgi:hypothetical protein